MQRACMMLIFSIRRSVYTLWTSSANNIRNQNVNTRIHDGCVKECTCDMFCMCVYPWYTCMHFDSGHETVESCFSWRLACQFMPFRHSFNFLGCCCKLIACNTVFCVIYQVQFCLNENCNKHQRYEIFSVCMCVCILCMYVCLYVCLCVCM